MVVTPGDSGRLYFVDTVGTSVVRRELGIRANLASAQAPDGRTLYLAVLLHDGARELLAIDLPGGGVRWREPFGKMSPRTIAGVEIWATAPMAVSPDGGMLYLGLAYRAGERGIAALDLSTRKSVRFAGPFTAHGGLRIIPKGTRFQQGALVVGASRDPNDLARAVYLLDPTTFAVLDSVLPNTMGGDRLLAALPAAADSALYLTGRTTIRRYDLATRRVIAVMQQANGFAALTSDAQHVVITDFGVWPDSPGSGMVTVRDAKTLALVRRIELPRENHLPRLSLAATAGPRAGQVYVTTGTAARGSLFGVQPSQLIELDVLSGTIVRVIALRDFGSEVAYTY